MGMMKVHFIFSILVAGIVYSAVSLKSRVPEAGQTFLARVHNDASPHRSHHKKHRAGKEKHRRDERKRRKRLQRERWRRLFD